MKTGIIVGTSVAGTLPVLKKHTIAYLNGSDLTVFDLQEQTYSYVEVSILIGLLLGSGTVDFVVTGCSSGQGMMLACNSIPGVLCGLIKDSTDAKLFTAINRGNSVSVPLKEGYGYSGEENIAEIMEALFHLPMDERMPPQQATRKLTDTKMLKKIRSLGQCDLIAFLNRLDEAMITKIMSARQVIDAVVKDGRNDQIVKWVKEYA